MTNEFTKNLFSILFFVLILSFATISCSKRNSDKPSEIDDLDSSQNWKSNFKNNDLDNYLTKCSQLNTWIGSIQDAEKSDSTGLYTFGECYDSIESYRLIWVQHNRSKLARMNIDQVKQAFAEGMSTSFRNFDIYCFVLPLLDPEKMSDFHTSHIQFPALIAIKKRRRNDWVLLDTITVSNSQEFGRIQLRTIFYR